MSALRTIRTVLWSFIGIRKKSEYEELGKANPFHIIAAALAVVALFVAGLIAFVHWVVNQH
jgi:hypothetical protein